MAYAGHMQGRSIVPVMANRGTISQKEMDERFAATDARVDKVIDVAAQKQPIELEQEV